MNPQIQNLSVLSNGVVKGGSASYQADLDTGLIHFQAAVDVGFLFITKRIQTDPGASYKVDPSMLLSKNLEKIGDKITVGPAQFSFLTADTAGNTTVSVSIGDTVSGEAEIDTSSEFIKINSIDVIVKWGRISAHVEANAIHLGGRIKRGPWWW